MEKNKKTSSYSRFIKPLLLCIIILLSCFGSISLTMPLFSKQTYGIGILLGTFLGLILLLLYYLIIFVVYQINGD